MPYVNKNFFNHDIFLSYARVDNTTTSSEPKGWVDLFLEELNVRLSKRIGRIGILDIWWDNEDLAGNQQINDTIKQALGKSAIFIALTSEGYLHPDSYCCHEIEWFAHQAKTSSFGLDTEKHKRIFNVLIQNIHYSQWPVQLQGALGFKMNTSEKAEEIGKPTKPGNELFDKQMDSLIDALYKMLKKINNLSSGTRDIKTQEKKGKIFLADVANTLWPVLKNIREELEKKGYETVPGSAILKSGDEHSYEQEIIKKITRADLSVHLFDECAGRPLEIDNQITISQKQFLVINNCKVPKYIWIPRELNISKIPDDYYKNFLLNIEKGDSIKTDYDFSRCFEESISAEIIDKLNSLTQSRESETGEKPQVLLDFHTKDTPSAVQAAMFFTQQKVFPFLFQEADNPCINIEDFTQKLNQVNVLIIFYGQVVSDWVMHRIKTVIQHLSSHFQSDVKTQMKAIGIYIAPPAKTETFDFPDFFNVCVLDGSRSPEFEPEILIPLLKKAGLEIKE